MCRAREDNIVVHAVHGFERPLVQIFLFLRIDSTEASADVSQNRAFPASLDMIFLPAQFQGEAPLEIQVESENLSLELCLDVPG
jgi:hypothetical protein